MNIQSSAHQNLLADALETIRKMRLKLKAVEAAKTEPIAIVGMDCQFPQANHSQGYWQLLHNGVDAVTEIPASRWEVSNYYDPDPSQPGKMYSRHGAFLDQVDQFDPHFFGISPLEAARLDPQQRLLLEVSYHALENAGQPLDCLKDSKTGVFVGICFDDYAQLSFKRGNLANIDAYSSLGNSKSIAVGRISYLFGFTGTALSLDTSCSSSLLAIHLACQSLKNRETNLALAGGVNLILSPEVSIGFSKLRALSPSGRCKTFDASADGYVRGEGCGLVVLKRLSDAVTDGDRILALIRGSAANQDGRSNGLTAPNGLAQEAVIAQALAEAGVQPHQIQYVETHGTGTSLGDPIEVLAINQVLCQHRSPDNPLYLGSVKTNFGHLEGAAGVAGLMKVVLSLQHQEIPPHLHLQTPNPYIPWKKMPLRIPSQPTPWLATGDSRYAGVSSFGMSGTNVHIILEEAKQPPVAHQSRPQQLLVFSAKTPSALETIQQNLAEHLKSEPNLNLADVAYTLSKGRSAYDYRTMLVAASGEEVVWAFSSPDCSNLPTESTGAKAPAVVFMFPGQGSQSINMGLDLYQTELLFRQQVDLSAELLKPLIGKDIREILYSLIPTSAIAEQLVQTEITQCALFIVEYALAQLWMSWGVQPVALVGHSIGEYVAACLAGVFSLEDALFLVAKRGKLMQQMPPGKMLALMGDEATVKALMSDFAAEQGQHPQIISLALINSASQCVVSGEISILKEFEKYCQQRGFKSRLLNTSHGFHSQMMEPIVPEFINQVSQIKLNFPQIPYLSNVTGTWITKEQAITPAYWGQHLRSCVRFADNLQELSKKPDYLLLEVGSGQTLSQLAKQQKVQQPDRILASLPQSSLQSDRLDYPGLKSILTTLGQLWLKGVNLNWIKFYEGQNRQKVSLPYYPFEKQSYWIDTGTSVPAVSSPVVASQNSSNSGVKRQLRHSTVTDSFVASRTPTEKQLRQILENFLGIEPLGVEDNFFELGVDSLLAIEIVSRLSQNFQIQLNQSQLLETPTIAKLAFLLDSKDKDAESSDSSPLIKIQEVESSHHPLFLIHPASGNAFNYLQFSKYLALNRPIYALEDPGLHGQKMLEFFPSKAAYYLELIRSIQPQGSYCLAGYSYGGNIALEMATQLTKAGEEVAFLGMLDSFPPSAYENIFIDDTRLLASLWHMTGLIFEKQPRNWLAELEQVEKNQQIDYILQQLLEDPTGMTLPSTLVQKKTIIVAMNNFRQLHHYVPQEPYPGKITYFWAETKIPESLSRLLNYQIPDDLIGDGWSKFSTQSIKSYLVPGHHFTMFHPTNLHRLVQQFQEAFKMSLSQCS
ncbi:MAG: acyltransferase domain-containing protein [Microcystis aeruginosa LG13-11]|jgi:acyl transferase domain-containing protein/thioesterase domain-containing protein|nr:acyltransferase domain-containing protein [Microcystis aeruginosa LG13-11]